MLLTDNLHVSEDVISREVGGELVLMHLGSGFYFGLNPMGARVWELLQAKTRTVAELVEHVVREFDVTAEEAANDLFALAKKLVEHELLVKSDVTD